MKNAKGILISIGGGILLGVCLVYFVFYRPADQRAAEYRRRAEQIDRELTVALADYQRSRDEFAGRIGELESTLSRERAAGDRAVERTRRAEARTGELAERLRGLSEASGRVEGIAGTIRDETDAALGDLETLRRLLEGGR